MRIFDGHVTQWDFVTISLHVLQFNSMQFEFNRQLPIALSTIPIIVIMSILRFTTIRSVSCSSFGAHAAAHAVIAIGSRQSAMVLRTGRQHVMPRVALVRPPPQHRPRQFLHMSTLALR